MDYRVRLDSFDGPLDLLLYLVKRNEIDVRDIPIARVAEQFLAYLQALQQIDVEVAGDFLVLAATLLEIKTRMLLPRPPEAERDEADPRLELVKQLLEYKKYKDAAQALEACAEQQQRKNARQPIPEPTPSKPEQQPLRKVELWDLVSAFGRLMRETMALQEKPIVLDDTPIHVHMEGILTQLRATARLSLRQLFTAPHTRSRLLGLFLAILELMKANQVLAEQEQAFGEIWLSAASR